jgi:hypothetical protein
MSCSNDEQKQPLNEQELRSLIYKLESRVQEIEYQYDQKINKKYSNSQTDFVGGILSFVSTRAYLNYGIKQGEELDAEISALQREKTQACSEYYSKIMKLKSLLS